MMDRTRMFSVWPGTPGRRQQNPRTIHRALGLSKLPFEEGLRQRREQRADDCADNGRKNQKSDLQGFARKMRREQAEIRLPSQKEARHAEHDDERNP